MTATVLHERKFVGDAERARCTRRVLWFYACDGGVERGTGTRRAKRGAADAASVESACGGVAARR